MYGSRVRIASVAQKLFIMEILIVLLFSIYIVSIFLLAGYYGNHSVSPNIWSILSVFIPIINTIFIICLLSKNNKRELTRFFSFKNFINELKDP